MPTETERLEVEKVIHDSIGWAWTKDIGRLFSIMMQDDDFSTPHPDSKSTIIQFEAFKKLGECMWLWNRPNDPFQHSRNVAPRDYWRSHRQQSFSP